MSAGLPFRAEVIGSMLRPDALREAMVPGGTEVEAERLAALQDAAVEEALAIQERAGVDVVTDGEMRRFVFTAPLTETLEGIVEIDPTSAPILHWHGDAGEEEDLPTFTGIGAPLRRGRSLAAQEFAFAAARTSQPIKMTLPSPMMLSSWWIPGISDAVYDDAFEAFAVGAEIVREEIAELAAAGCEYVQIDAPELATHVLNEDQRAHWESRGIAPDRFLDEGVEILDEVARDAPLRIGLHVCRGNYSGKWMGAGGYDEIARRVFARARNFDAFALEYDSPRAGSFAPLGDVPDDKVVILGLLSTKHDELESVAQLRERVAEAAEHFPREQLALSTQCGFASSAYGNPIAWETQERKLTLVAELAHELWA